jgi:peptidase M1-like protein
MNYKSKIFAVALFIPLLVFSQYELPISKNFAKAIKNQTRTTKGIPGPNYWQNRVSYNITAEVIPGEKKLIGSETIIFENNSPDTLDHILMHVYQNLYKKGNPKDQFIHPDDVHSGVTIESVKIKEKEITELESVVTLLVVGLKDFVYPSEVITIEVKWSFTIPSKSDIRMGGKDSTSFFLGQWFPRIAVYDDLKGWDGNIHSGDEEFYYEIGDFDYSVKLPEGYMVWGTGLLQNAEKVLSKNIFKKYKHAQKSNDIISIVSESDYIQGEKLTKDNTWRFKAENVSDIAFGISNHFLWDATSTIIAGNRVFVEAAYSKESKDFKEVAQLAKKSITYLSTELPGVPYPFPAVSVFNGTNGRSGMEYPMIANNPSADNRGRTVDVTVHEISHNYFPFYVLTNETEYAWMDEAFASMIPYKYQLETGPTSNRLTRYVGYVNKFANTDRNIATNTNSTFIKGNISSYNFYSKPAVSLYILQDILGEELFKECLIEYIKTWKRKHPAPEDFFYLMNETAQNNLNWFWKSWFYENEHPDLGIEKVNQKEHAYEVTIRKIGNLPVPIYLTITFDDKTTKVLHQTATVWEKNGQSVLTVKSGKEIKRIKLGNDYIPDTDSKNNSYEIK